MHYFSNKYSGRRNSVVRGSNLRQNNRARSFDPSLFVGRSVAEVKVEENFVPTNAFADFKISDQIKKILPTAGIPNPHRFKTKRFRKF